MKFKPAVGKKSCTISAQKTKIVSQQKHFVYTNCVLKFKANLLLGNMMNNGILHGWGVISNLRSDFPLFQ